MWPSMGPPEVRCLPAGYPRHLLALPAVSSEQLLVLVLLAAAFAAGWFARGGRADGAPAEEGAADEPLPVVPPPAALDPVMVGDADAVLDRAISAARAARAVALGPAGASEAATRAV